MEYLDGDTRLKAFCSRIVWDCRGAIQKAQVDGLSLRVYSNEYNQIYAIVEKGHWSDWLMGFNSFTEARKWAGERAFKEVNKTKQHIMSNYDKLYVVKPKVEVPIDQLIQLLRIVADGDLISKDDRNKLVEIGFANKVEGFNIITVEGIEYLHTCGRLKS